MKMKSILEYLLSKTKGNNDEEYDRTKPEFWEVGDILCGTAGWSMCLPRWYKIVKRTAKKITCIRLEGKIVSGHKNGQWEEMPTDNQSRYDTKEFNGMITERGTVKIDDVYVHLWDGKTPLQGDDMD